MRKTKHIRIKPPPAESLNELLKTINNAKTNRKNRKHETRKERQMHNSNTTKTQKTNMRTQPSQAESLNDRSIIKNNEKQHAT